MNIIIGIDDTDNLTSRGTGFIARQLAFSLHEKALFIPKLVVRHQLFVHQSIPYTSHNSSASIGGTLSGNLEDLIRASEDFLINNCAQGSDAGFCVADDFSTPHTAIIAWGKNAKSKILLQHDAPKLAQKHMIYLNGLTGAKTGIIGALAAVGLHLWGNDGRVLWMKGLREASGIKTASDIKLEYGIDLVKTIDNHDVPDKEKILLTEWTRPVLIQKKITLFVEQNKTELYDFQTATKSFITGISQ